MTSIGWLQAEAQNNTIRIEGRITDHENKPIEYVSVTATAPHSTTILCGTLCQENGTFCLEVGDTLKQILLHLSSVGYENVEKTLNVPCPYLELKMNAKVYELSNVIISGDRINRTPTGYLANLKGADFAQGQQISEALNFLPGVSVQNGVYKINGMNVSEIYVDGMKLSNWSELNGVSAEMVETVAVEYLAGSNRNAGMTGGILHIKLRTPPEKGYYGNIGASLSARPAYGFDTENVNGLINFSLNKVRIYDYAAVNWSQATEEEDNSILYHTTGEESKGSTKTKSYAGYFYNRISLSWQASPKTTVGLGHYITQGYYDARSLTDYFTSKGSDHSDLRNDAKYTAHEVTAILRSQLNERGTFFSLTGDYYHQTDKSDWNNRSSLTNGDEKNRDKTGTDLWKVETSLDIPVSQSVNVSTGGFLQFITSDYHPLSVTTPEEWFTASRLRTHTSGFTPMLYANLQGSWKKMQYSVGINLQHNHIGYEVAEQNLKSHNNQWGVNPTIQMSCLLNEKHQHLLSLAYKQTLNDIPYSAISPVIQWQDSYNYTIGNPDLKAQREEQLMLVLSLFKRKLNITGIAVRSHHELHYATFTDPERPQVLYTQPINLSGTKAGALLVESNLKPLKFWRTKLEGMVMISEEDGEIDGITYNGHPLRYKFAWSNNFTFRKNFGGTLYALYEPDYWNYNRKYHTVYDLTGSLYRKFCKGNMQVRLSGLIFAKMRKLTIASMQTTTFRENTTHPERISISFTWNFQKGKHNNVDGVEGIQNYKKIEDDK